MIDIDTIAQAIDPDAWDINNTEIGIKPFGTPEAEWRAELFKSREGRRRRARVAAGRVAKLLGPGWRAAIDVAVRVAKNSCLVPPDGGAPTGEEREMCEIIASNIAALRDKGCMTCGGTGSVTTQVDTDTGPQSCPYLGEPRPDCS